MSSGFSAENYCKSNLIYIILFLQCHLCKPLKDGDNLHKLSKAELVAKAKKLNSFTWRGETNTIFGWGHFWCQPKSEWDDFVARNSQKILKSQFEYMTDVQTNAMKRYLKQYGKLLYPNISFKG